MRRGDSVLPQVAPQLTGNTSPRSIKGETQAYCRGPISAPCLPTTNDDPHHIRSLPYYALSKSLRLLWKLRIFHKRLDLRLYRPPASQCHSNRSTPPLSFRANSRNLPASRGRATPHAFRPIAMVHLTRPPAHAVSSTARRCCVTLRRKRTESQGGTFRGRHTSFDLETRTASPDFQPSTIPATRSRCTQDSRLPYQRVSCMFHSTRP